MDFSKRAMEALDDWEPDHKTSLMMAVVYALLAIAQAINKLGEQSKRT